MRVGSGQTMMICFVELIKSVTVQRKRQEKTEQQTGSMVI
jgi:hypothetical protein